MPRSCTVCIHKKLEAINKLIVAGEPNRRIASQYGLTEAAIRRHKKKHLPGSLIKAQAVTEVAQANNVMLQLQRCFERVNLLFDACDRWLRDADDPSRYDIGPRADDVIVTYYGPDNKTKEGRASKAPLSNLLAKLNAKGYQIEKWETRYADPRTLILKTAQQLQGQTELLARLMGELNNGMTVNIIYNQEWIEMKTVIIETLEPYPEVQIEMVKALEGK